MLITGTLALGCPCCHEILHLSTTVGIRAGTCSSAGQSEPADSMDTDSWFAEEARILEVVRLAIKRHEVLKKDEKKKSAEKAAQKAAEKVKKAKAAEKAKEKKRQSMENKQMQKEDKASEHTSVKLAKKANAKKANAEKASAKKKEKLAKGKGKGKGRGKGNGKQKAIKDHVKDHVKEKVAKDQQKVAKDQVAKDQQVAKDRPPYQWNGQFSQQAKRETRQA